jgi:hypothetical protein
MVKLIATADTAASRAPRPALRLLVKIDGGMEVLNVCGALKGQQEASINQMNGRLSR